MMKICLIRLTMHHCHHHHCPLLHQLPVFRQTMFLLWQSKHLMIAIDWRYLTIATLFICSIDKQSIFHQHMCNLKADFCQELCMFKNLPFRFNNHIMHWQFAFFMRTYNPVVLSMCENHSLVCIPTCFFNVLILHLMNTTIWMPNRFSINLISNPSSGRYYMLTVTDKHHQHHHQSQNHHH